jgi:hypothetical protein
METKRHVNCLTQLTGGKRTSERTEILYMYIYTCSVC